MSNTRNVVMMLPGEDEQLKNEYIIIGAHFDHLGMGGRDHQAGLLIQLLFIMEQMIMHQVLA